MDEITKKQQAVLDFIEEYQMNYGKSPTLKEMREHLRVSSDNSVLKHLAGLVKKGFIMKDDTPRGIKMLSSVRERLETGVETASLPLLGMIPAGGAALSEEHVIDHINIDRQFVPSPEKSFMLRVTGESMVDVGILEGDLVIASMQKQAKVGDIVVALVDGENTIKKLVKGNDGQLYLQAENPDYNDIYALRDLQVQGVVVGLIRKFT
ncbi:transcriptional repressor LexA [Candidatus Peregrinibacteria bacterium]|jgi:repressor LexA|nr:transcriptional repressor LexA [Candidatus Peregrinibacteria bacterium]